MVFSIIIHISLWLYVLYCMNCHHGLWLLVSPPLSTIRRLINLILQNNIFKFGDHHYHQIQGTAMGTKMAPPYANLFISYIEQEFLNSQELKPTLWLWFIDDIFLIWDPTLEEYESFFNNLNNHTSLRNTSSTTSTTYMSQYIKRMENWWTKSISSQPMLTSILTITLVTPPIIRRAFHLAGL
jgi:hypothetical protein